MPGLNNGSHYPLIYNDDFCFPHPRNLANLLLLLPGIQHISEPPRHTHPLPSPSLCLRALTHF
jgi:hypothetical protein